MNVCNPPDSPQLAMFVKTIWVAQSGCAAGLEKILPTTCGQLLINLHGHRLSHLDSRGNPRRQTGPIGVQGVLTRPVLIDKEQKTRICGVQFAAGGLTAFTDRCATHFVDDVVNAREIWGSTADLLHATLQSESDPTRQCDQIEALLLKQLRRRPEEDDLLRYCTSALAHGTEVTEVQKTAGLSQRKLHMLFDRRVGIRPKLFARIERFSAGLPGVEQQAALSDLATDLGYSDQAHLTREFRHFAEATPRSVALVDGEPQHADVELNKIFKTGVAESVSVKSHQNSGKACD